MWITDVLNDYPCEAEKLLSSFIKSSEERVDLLESMINGKFPKSYREFLIYCGGGPCAVFSDITADFGVEELIGIYEEYDEYPDDFPSNDWFIIGSGHYGTDFIMNLKTQKIIQGDDENTGIFLSNSFIDFFKQRLFLKLCILDKVDNYRFSISKVNLDDISSKIDEDILKICEKYCEIDFSLSDERQKILKGNKIKIYMSIDDYSVLIYLSGEDSMKYVNDLKEKFDIIDVKPSK